MARSVKKGPFVDEYLLKKVADEINEDGKGKAVYAKTDVTKKEEVKALVDKAVKEFGKIDVMINNAGLMAIAPLSETKVDEWDQMIDVNIKGVLYGIAAALPISAPDRRAKATARGASLRCIRKSPHFRTS